MRMMNMGELSRSLRMGRGPVRNQAYPPTHAGNVSCRGPRSLSDRAYARASPMRRAQARPYGTYHKGKEDPVLYRGVPSAGRVAFG
jgi:hypothetical protein